MRELVPYVVVGLASGSLYGLAGLGLVLTYRTSGIFNFAHGTLAAIGAYAFFQMHQLSGLPTWLALLLIGLDNAAVWGIAAGVLNLVPYVGSLVTAGASGLVGFLQFGSLDMAIVVASASLFIHMLVGNLFTPWLTSRASRMSPVAVFIGLLA